MYTRVRNRKRVRRRRRRRRRREVRSRIKNGNPIGAYYSSSYNVIITPPRSTIPFCSTCLKTRTVFGKRDLTKCTSGSTTTLVIISTRKQKFRISRFVFPLHRPKKKIRSAFALLLLLLLLFHD